MAYEDKLRSISVEASADLSAHQYKFMTVNSSGQLALSTANAKTDGVLQDKPAAAGRAGQLGVEGVTKVLLGGTVTAGDDVAVATGGVANTAGTGDVVAGRALTGGASGEIATIMLNKQLEPLA